MIIELLIDMDVRGINLYAKFQVNIVINRKVVEPLELKTNMNVR